MNPINFTPFPTLQSTNFILRKMVSGDAHEIFLLRSNERILTFLNIPPTDSETEALRYIEKINAGIDRNEWIMWAISLGIDQPLIGTICFWNISRDDLTADIGFVLHPGHQGKGIMKQIMPMIIAFGFETMKLNFIDAVVHPENLQSIRLLEKNGFKYDRKTQEETIYSLVNPKYNS